MAEARPLLDPSDHRALTRLLQRTLGRGFKLAVVELAALDDHQRLLDLAQTDIEALCGVVVGVDVADLAGMNLWEELRTPLAEAEPTRAVIVLWGLIEVRVDVEGLVRQLNVQRDLFTRDFAMPWLVAASPAVARALQQDAPDFADYASLWVKGGEVARW